MANELVTLQEKGLTTEEAALVQKWLESNKPGISRIKADFLSSVYNLGYTCLQIHQKFPEYSLESLLWARIHFEWDKRRTDYTKELATSTVLNAGEAHLEGINFLSVVLKTVQADWRNQIIKWMAAPDREKRPDFLPTSMHQFMAVQEQLADLIAPPDKKKGDTSNPTQVYINNTAGGQVQVNPGEVAKTMIEQMKSGKPK